MFSLTANQNPLVSDIFPPVQLETSSKYEVALIDLYTYNTIPNIENNINDKFSYNGKQVKIPVGSYELDDIVDYIRNKLSLTSGQLKIKANNNTLQCELYADREIDISMKDSVAPILGFQHMKLEANKWHISTKPVHIMRVNSIRVECNIAKGSYDNGSEGHILYEFYTTVPPVFKIIVSPKTVVYLPINTNRIDHIRVKLIDQNNELINFRGETITVRLHVRKSPTI